MNDELNPTEPEPKTPAWTRNDAPLTHTPLGDPYEILAHRSPSIWD